MSELEQTPPDGDPIEVHTFWLDFGDQGETAISADLTRFNAAMARAKRKRHPDET